MIAKETTQGILKKFFFKFIYFERERSPAGEGQKERGTQDPKQALC